MADAEQDPLGAADADAAADANADANEQLASAATVYQQIGGASVLRQMVDRFYDLMELEHEFTGIRVMHPVALDGSRDKLFWFLSGWMGGPDLYQQRLGHPRLRARHMPFAIGTSERDQWLRAMAWAMQDVGIAEALRLRLMESFYQTADWMCNQPR
jgi:hemoglobin